MQIMTNGIYITGYAVAGIVEGGIEIDKSVLPENFFDDFAEKKFLYFDGKVTEIPTISLNPSLFPNRHLRKS